MRYATWKLSFQPDGLYGVGPEAAVAANNGSMEGIFTLGPEATDVIVGYIDTEMSLSDFGEWDVTEITAAEALALAQEGQPEAGLDDDGRLTFPPMRYE